MRSLGPRFLAAIAASVVALSCGTVPTFDGGIAYIGPIDMPALAILAGDTLRDSLGHVAPLRVQAFGEGDQPIPNVPASFIVNTAPFGVKIDANGIVTALDSPRTVQIVGKVADRLQTASTNLEVVPQPDLIASTGTIDSLKTTTASSALQVAVTGDRKGTRLPVSGIIVHYRIVFPQISDTVLFFTEGVRGHLSQSTDTTAGGVASRSIITIDATQFDSVIVEATARNLKGDVLSGSPVRFRIPVKKGS